MARAITFENLNVNLVRVHKDGECVGFIRRQPGLNWISDIRGVEVADDSVQVIKKAVRLRLAA